MTNTQQPKDHDSLESWDQGQFLTIRLKKAPPSLSDYLLVDRQQLTEYAFPKFINAWLLDPTPAQSLF